MMMMVMVMVMITIDISISQLSELLLSLLLQCVIIIIITILISIMLIIILIIIIISIIITLSFTLVRGGQHPARPGPPLTDTDLRASHAGVSAGRPLGGPLLTIGYSSRGVQSEGDAVDGGSII